MTAMTPWRQALLCAALLLAGSPAAAQTLKVLTTGAMKGVVTALVPGFVNKTGVQVQVANDTAGALLARIQAGEAFDLVVLTPAALDTLAQAGRVQPGSVRALAQVGIALAVKQGAAAPPMATVPELVATLRAARRVAYIDPASGGSSGVYLAGLFQRLGLAEHMAERGLRVRGGLVAERVANGEADVALHQASEILAVPGVTLVAPLPAQVQHYTRYGFALAAGSPLADAAEVFARALTGHTAAEVMRLYRIEPQF